MTEDSELESGTEQVEESSQEKSGLSIREAIEVAARETGHDSDEENDTATDTGTLRAVGKSKSAAPGTTPQSPPAQQETDEVTPPEFWKGHHKQLFAKLPKEAKDAVNFYEKQRNEWAYKLANEVAGVRQRQKELDGAFSPIRPEMERLGATEAQVVSRFIGWHQQMKNESTRLSTLRDFLKSWGVSPQQLIEQDAGSEEEGDSDPRYEEISSEVRQLRELWEQQQQAAQQAEQQQWQQAMMSEIQAFAAERDTSGNLLRPYVGVFEPQIAQVISYLRAQGSTASPRELMQQAYEHVISQLREQGVLHGSNGTNGNAAKVQAARKAASSISPSSGSFQPAQQKPKDIRAALEMADAMLRR